MGRSAIGLAIEFLFGIPNARTINGADPIRHLALLFCGSLAFAPPALADVDIQAADACLAAAFDAGGQGGDCVEIAHAECTALPEEAPAVAVLCFTDGQRVWDTATAATMKSLATRLPEDVAAITGIEVKYDILSGLLQCDRLEELAIAVSDLPSGTIAREKARCAATVAGLAYTRLRWRAQGLK